MLLQPGKQSKRTCSKKMKRYKFYHCRARPRYQSRYLFTFTTTGSRSFGLHEIFKCSHLKFTVYGHKQASKQTYTQLPQMQWHSSAAAMLLRFVQFQIASFTLDECSQALRSCVLLWTQTEGKNRGGLGTRLLKTAANQYLIHEEHYCNRPLNKI